MSGACLSSRFCFGITSVISKMRRIYSGVLNLFWSFPSVFKRCVFCLEVNRYHGSLALRCMVYVIWERCVCLCVRGVCSRPGNGTRICQGSTQTLASFLVYLISLYLPT